MELDVTPTFPTLIGRVRLPDAEAMNQGLHALILVTRKRNIQVWGGATSEVGTRAPTSFIVPTPM